MKKLRDGLVSLNARFRIVSVEHLDDCKNAIEMLRTNGMVGERFYKEYLESFEFRKPETLSDTRSIIVIAVPQPSSIIDVAFRGRHVRAIIPPTYIFKDVREKCTRVLSDVLCDTGAGFALTRLPLKFLSVRSGLGNYGRNDISYVAGMGSFHRLEGFFTDYEFGIDDWQDVSMMGSCTGCSLCVEACPTGCIPGEKMLVDAERCLTYVNENEGDFPSWISLRSHNSLVGCMRCQMVCPENRDFLKDRDKEEQFTEEETETILRKISPADLPQEISAKLGRLGIDWMLPLLSRNLAALLKV